ncbi:MAG: nucleotidyl transferase AbiEii/AbiGii toxin family protein [Candidatus Aenigmarchaeota archaeon]|nr:nucleotidyl transferase AbiEii/AbiGii toxin family protein [Candidatus Aenigmarchaeota archaeon]
MINENELREKAKIKGISLGNAEKEYLIDLMLLAISRNIKDELVFKGGTCLYKFYKLDRFSEDIDFTAIKPIDIEQLIASIKSDLAIFGINSTVSSKKMYNAMLIKFKCQGPLFRGKYPCSVRFDVNFKSIIEIEPVVKNYSSLYSDIPAFSLLIMDEKEILAEKVRAIMSRDKARDVYDLWFLLDKGVNFDMKLVAKKLEYYNKKFDKILRPQKNS